MDNFARKFEELPPQQGSPETGAKFGDDANLQEARRKRDAGLEKKRMEDQHPDIIGTDAGQYGEQKRQEAEQKLENIKSVLGAENLQSGEEIAQREQGEHQSAAESIQERHGKLSNELGDAMPENQMSRIELMQQAKQDWWDAYYNLEGVSEEDCLRIEDAHRDKFYATKNGILERLQNLPKDAEKEKGQMEEFAAMAQEAEQNLGELKRSKISKLFNFLKISKIENRKEYLEDRIKYHEKKYQEIQEITAELQGQIDDQEGLEQAEKDLFQFYRGNIEEWDQAREKEKKMDLGETSTKHDVFFVHAIRNRLLGGQQAVREGYSDWQTKMRVTMSLEPTLSASSVSKWDNIDNMWARVGFVLNGGEIEDASSQDLWTKPTGLKKRERGNVLHRGEHQTSTEDAIDKRVEEAIKNRGRNRHNEFIVSQPQIAGIYRCIDPRTFEDANFDKMQEEVPDEELAKFAEENGLPLFVIERGVVLKGRYDSGSKKIVAEKTSDDMVGDNIAISPSDLIAGKGYDKPDLSQKKKKIIEDIFKKSPFEIKSPEVDYVNSRLYGREYYIKKNAVRAKEYLAAGGNVDLNFTNGGKIFFRIGEDSNLEEVIGNRHDSGREPHSLSSKYESFFGNGGSAIGRGSSYMQFENPANTNEEYLEEMEKLIGQYETDIQEAQRNGKETWVKDYLPNLAYHLYGFGEQADMLGDTEMRDKAWELARKVTSTEEIQRTIEKRIDSEGNLKISEEDLDNL